MLNRSTLTFYTNSLQLTGVQDFFKTEFGNENRATDMKYIPVLGFKYRPAAMAGHHVIHGICSRVLLVVCQPAA
jgi:hypothetical protein